MPVSFLPPPPAWQDQALRKAQPPEWLLHEAQLRAVLFMNHVLQANPHALPRTRRLAGRSVQMRWQGQAMQWVFTPVGLLDAVKVDQVADLILDLGDVSPWQLANHVLQSAPSALPRTRRLAGKSVQIRWQKLSARWVFTPAGLLESAPVGQSDLALDLGDVTPWDLAGHAWRGQRPPLRIEGDVQMAAEVNWLVDHVRWSPEEDLARLMGDAQARAVFQMGQRMAQALRAFVPARAPTETGAA